MWELQLIPIQQAKVISSNNKLKSYRPYTEKDMTKEKKMNKRCTLIKHFYCKTHLKKERNCIAFDSSPQMFVMFSSVVPHLYDCILSDAANLVIMYS